MLRLVLIVACLINAFPTAARAASPDPAMRVVVLAPHLAGGWTMYPLRVERAGSPTIVLVPIDAKLATLEVNGVVVQRVGRDIPMGRPPLGHGTPSFLLEGLHPSDRIVVHLAGSSLPTLRIVGDVSILTSAYTVGLWGGAYYAVLATMALFWIAGLFTFMNATSAWYGFFLITMIAAEVEHDGAFSFAQNRSILTPLAFQALSLLAFVGFAASFLRLPAIAPRLFRLVVILTIAVLAIAGCIIAVTHWETDTGKFIIPIVVTNFVLITIGVIRQRSGYEPAKLFCFALSGMTALLIAKIFGDLTGTSITFLDHWGFEIGGAFDVFAFSVALSHRSQFMLREGRRMEGELEAATFAALHDPLTGLLNRRGLERSCAESLAPVATVLYLDIDGFKSINDGGGHAAGDAALRSLASIVRDAVRSDDLVARVGGDEFVIVLIHAPDQLEIRRIIDRMSAAVSSLRPLGDQNSTRIGVSIGVGRLTSDTTFEAALAEADADAYKMKTQHYLEAGAISLGR